VSLIPIVSSMVVGIEERREFKEEQQELGNSTERGPVALRKKKLFSSYILMPSSLSIAVLYRLLHGLGPSMCMQALAPLVAAEHCLGPPGLLLHRSILR